MRYLTRKEVLQKLIDFNNIYSYMIMESKVKILPLYCLSKNILNGNAPRDINNFQSIMENSPLSINDFQSIINVYRLVNYSRLISLTEESFINSINNDNFDLSKYKKNIKDGGIFVEGDGHEFTSNKRILQYIRDAFNHNDDSSFSKYRISDDGQFLEVYLRQVEKNKVFHVQLSIYDLSEIISKLVENKHSFDEAFIIDPTWKYNQPLNTASITRVKSIDKAPAELSHKISTTHFNSQLEARKKTINTLEQNNIRYREEKYNFDNYQLEYLKYIKKLSNIFPKSIRKNMFNMAVKEAIPGSMEKLNRLLFNDYVIQLFDPDLSYNQIIERITNVISRKEHPLTPIEKNIRDLFKENHAEPLLMSNFIYSHLNRHDIDTTVFYAFSNGLLDMNSCIKDAEGNPIVFSNDEDESKTMEHIRNALTHGWYFVNHKNEYHLYDNSNRNRNNYNFYCHAAISKSLLVDRIAQDLKWKTIEYEKNPKKTL